MSTTPAKCCLFLPNGLRVVTETIDPCEVASLYVGVAVGSACETEAGLSEAGLSEAGLSEAGLCHLIEHMFFKGTDHLGPGEIAALVEGWGGQMNAYTSFDATVYYINLPCRHLQEAIELMADILQKPLMDPQELEREKEVVCEEIRKGEDEPHHLIAEKLFELAFPHHPYGRPIIGEAASVKAFKREHIMNFLGRYYRANHITVSLAGKLDDKTITWVENAFGHLPAEGVPHPSRPHEEKAAEPRHLVVTKPLAMTYFQRGYAIPELMHPDTPALEVMAHILGERSNSYLEAELIHKSRLATSIYAYAYTPQDPGLFVIGGTALPANLEKALKKITDVLPRALDNLTQEELTLARQNILSQKIYQEQTVSGRARKNVTLAMLTGDPDYDKIFYQQLMGLSRPAIQEIFAKYITGGQPVQAVLAPKMNIKQDRLARTLIPSQTAKISLAKKPTSRWHRSQLAPGLELVTLQRDHAPLISLYAATCGGIFFEKMSQAGRDHLIADLLPLGTTSNSREEIAHLMERIAGEITGFSGRNSLGLACQFLSDYLFEGTQLFADVLTHPALPRHEFKKERDLVLADIRQRQDNPTALVVELAYRLLYGDHPYANHPMGTLKTVKGLTHHDIVSGYRSRRHQQPWVIAAAGDIEHERLCDRLKKLLGQGVTPRGPAAPKKHALRIKPPQVSALQYTHHIQERAQAHLVVAFLGNALSARDRYAMDILTQLLSGQGGRLFIELRDKQSLAYHVNVIHAEGLHRGLWGVIIGCDPSKSMQAYTMILAELKRLQTHPPTSLELTRAKEYLKGSFLMAHQRASHLANLVALNRLYGLTIEETLNYAEKIDAVKLEEVLAAAHKYLKLECATVALVGPAQADLKLPSNL